MRVFVLLIMGIFVSVVLSCSGGSSAGTTARPAAPAASRNFERMEAGNADAALVYLDKAEGGGWECGIMSTQTRKSGGGAYEIRTFDLSHKSELKFGPNATGTFIRWMGESVVQQQQFTSGFFEVFGIFDSGGQPSANLEAGEDFARILFFDTKGQLRIRLEISGVKNEWQEAVTELVFYDENGDLIEF